MGGTIGRHPHPVQPHPSPWRSGREHPNAVISLERSGFRGSGYAPAAASLGPARNPALSHYQPSSRSRPLPRHRRTRARAPNADARAATSPPEPALPPWRRPLTFAKLPSSPSDETLPTPSPLITRVEFPSLRLGTRPAPPRLAQSRRGARDGAGFALPCLLPGKGGKRTSLGLGRAVRAGRPCAADIRSRCPI